MLIKTIDFLLVQELDQVIFRNKAYSLNAYEEMINNCSFFLIQENNENIGFIIFCKTGDDLELIKIGILNSYRHQMLATKALKVAIDTLEYKCIFLEVSSLNIIAIRLYQSLGFNLIHTRKNYYSDNSDALIMKLMKS